MTVKRAVLRAAQATGLAGLARRASAGSLRILCYHGLWLLDGRPYGNTLFVTPAQFAGRMRRLRASGQPVLPLGEAVARLAAGDLPPAAVAITIDDGWASTHSHMLPVLESLGLPATLYATTWYSAHADLPVVNVAAAWLCERAGLDAAARAAAIARIEALPVAERLPALRAFGAGLGVAENWLAHRQFHNMTAAQLADAAARGLDVQLHTHRHIDIARDVDALPRELADNAAFLAGALGTDRFAHFCYPSGQRHPRAAAMLRAAGIRSATTCIEGINPPGRDPLALDRLLDGRDVDDATFDGYLAGTLHYLNAARRLGRRIQA